MTNNNNDEPHWFEALRKRFDIDTEIMEPGDTVVLGLTPSELWQGHVSAPLLGWLAACNSKELAQRQVIKDQVACLVSEMLATIEREQLLGSLSEQFKSPTISNYAYGGLLTRLGQTINFLGHIEGELKQLRDDRPIRRSFPHNVASAIDSIESVFVFRFMLDNPDGPAYSYSLESEVRSFLKFDPEAGIVPVSPS